jgi:N-acetylmuramoyl-L-alanine amidase
VDRWQARRSRRIRTYSLLAVAVVAAVALLVGGVMLTLRFAKPAHPPAPVRVSAPASALSTVSAVSASKVEVPNLVGRPLAEAQALAEAAGFTVRSRIVSTLPPDPEQSVRSQDPSAGVVVQTGTLISLAVCPIQKGAKTSKRPDKQFVVVLDPGHQSHGDPLPESIAPSSTQTQPRATGGGTGVSTRVPEYEVDLEIATTIKQRLEAEGVRVVMTRTTNDVNLSNRQRAEIANAEKADLFLRVHADSSANGAEAGVSTYYPEANRWTKGFSAASERAAQSVQAALVSSTSAADRGVVARGDVAGFNWSKVPAIGVQCGYQSNSVEDRLLTSARYQAQIADGIAEGVMKWLEGGK